ncbi:MAG: saccharopine dehydrogenase NADP-binding domain-containing protein [Methanomicrobiales archaeon]|nr:saccharopine dehydrogenase NADP-binding domain-containing protein [Methanomicrobiales archaeon]
MKKKSRSKEVNSRHLAVEFQKKVLIIGYGAVARCTLPILLKHVKIPYENITILDFEDKAGELRSFTEKGVHFFCRKITPENLEQILSEYLEQGGLCIDLAWNIDCCAIVQWCHDHDVLYMNTSVEVWDSYEERFVGTPYEKSLYARQMRLKELTSSWQDATTFIVDHGANPGLISHFAKQGLIDIAERMVAEGIATDPARMQRLIREQDFALLAREVGVKVIHCSERDTQISCRPKEVDEFVGTWSIEGLREEGTAPAEIGWGTHEKEFPLLAHVPPTGPKNQIMLAQMGMNTWVRSWVPHQEIVGMVIRHGEAFGICDRWTVWENGVAVYRPTVHYAYMPCDGTIVSLHELKCRNYEMQSRLRILRDDEILSGADTLGALLMGHPYHCWWTGSILSIGEAHLLAPGQNATTVQVALGVVTAVMWMILNPRRGFCLPDDLPHDFVLDIALPYLGEFYSGPSDWTPLKNRTVYFQENPANNYDTEDVWQFKNFLFVN